AQILDLVVPRTTADHLSVATVRAARITVGAAPVILIVVRVGDPFRGVPGKIVDTVDARSGRERADRDWPFRPVVARVRVAPVPLFAPRIFSALWTTGRFLPLGFRRKSLADGAAIRLGLVPRDPDDGLARVIQSRL